MCNLYRHVSNQQAIRQLFAVAGDVPALEGDAWPDRPALIIRDSTVGRVAEALRWGFPPPPGLSSRPVTNVRNLASPFWRTALSRPDRRCLVPAQSFCEWTGEKGSKRKVWFATTDSQPFAFAGLWRPAEDGARFALLTCAPNALVAPVHPKAMPVILLADDYARWLTSPLEDAVTLAAPYPTQLMRIEPDESALLL